VTRKPIYVEVAMPSGPEHYWREMRRLGSKGFTVRAIANASDGVSYETVRRYVWWLQKEGYVARVGQKQDGYAVQAIYVVKKATAHAPIERAAPRAIKAREAMWNAIRALKQFTARELAVSAATEERPISQRSANLYIQRLAQAGVLQVVVPPRRATGKIGPVPRGAIAGTWRLRKNADTGPEAPKLCNAGFVFDPNKNAVLGDAVITEQRL
jgi:hypothetical protein